MKHLTPGTGAKSPRVHPLLRLATCLMPLGLTLAATAAEQPQAQSANSAEFQRFPGGHNDFSPLIDKVRRATARYRNFYVAKSEGWVRGTPCVSGPEAGAMGIHFLYESRIHDGALNAREPEALIYEPTSNGGLRLVGVEFITIASEWLEKHPDGAPPDLDGHLAHFVDSPNRYGLPPFYELHVWAWEDNPSGSFADWNTEVSCDKATPNVN
ncbi:MAG: hypothetical protein ABI885_31185 [Gammaproteobacteria bacterium]